MSYNDILPRYAKIHRRAVLLGLHIDEAFPTDEAEEVHVERDRLRAKLADLWADMGAGTIRDNDERDLPADVVSKRDVDADREEETRSHEVTIRGEVVQWERKETRLTEAAAAVAAAAVAATR